MTVGELEREQSKSLPADDLSPYRGQWVALREGRVVASAMDSIELREHPDVKASDALIPVPTQSSGIYLL